MLGQPEVVVRRQADQAAAVDVDLGALGAAQHPQRAVEVLGPQGGDLVVEEAERAGPGHVVQSMMTLPLSPLRAVAKAAS